MNGRARLSRMILAALFLAIAFVLPYLTGQLPEIGAMLCPMHLPVLLCGFVCGWSWGLTVGSVAPLLRSLLTGGFPPMFPTAVCMALELATYGLAAALTYRVLPRRRWTVYPSLLIAMLAGRIVWGCAMLLLVGARGGFGWSVFLAGAVTNALPGILLQLLLIPPPSRSLSASHRAHPFHQSGETNEHDTYHRHARRSARPRPRLPVADA